MAETPPRVIETENGATIYLCRLDGNASFDGLAVNRYRDFHPVRGRQLAAADWVAQHVFGVEESIQRDTTGRPSVQGAEISISHTDSFLGMIRHRDTPVAIDLERATRNVEHILPRFTTDEELHLVHPHWRHCAPVAVWSAKECLFKIMRLRGVHFRTQLALTAWSTPFASQWQVNHPDLCGRFSVNTAIFDDLLVSYIDQPML